MTNPTQKLRLQKRYLFYNMESKAYNLQVRLVCPGCSRGNCYEHISKKSVFDEMIGLQIEFVCVCNHSKDAEN